jgi:predicted hydrocarbon binding protein
MKRALDKEIRFGAQPPCVPEEVSSLLKSAQFDSDRGEITFAGSDWILMRGSTLRALMERVMRLPGTEGMRILSEAGKHTGKELAKAILKEETALKELPKWLTALSTRSGWGKIETRVDHNHKRAVVEIYNCATSRGIHSEEASCHFIRGYIEGIGEIILKEPVECSENKCASKGDTSCFFRIQRKISDTSSQRGETRKTKREALL